MTTINNRFQFKEDYKAFRAAWAKAVNHKNAKSTVDANGYRTKGWITATDHILFNHLLGRPLNTGFSPIVNSKKLANGATANQTFDLALKMFEAFWMPAFEKIEGVRELHKFDRPEAIQKNVDRYLEGLLTVAPEIRGMLLRAIVRK